jgi:MoaA/NifB/PqqE/SkfB family radical SAM enzyme
MAPTESRYRFAEVSEVKYLNVEITTKCSLRCPMCPRTVFPQFLDLKHEMPLSFIRQIAIGPALKKIYLCGANGDPIQHSQFHEVIRILKDATPAQINFHTHGCFRTAQWWESLLEILRPTDHIIFSIDGLADTNSIYRVNSNWKQIETAARMAAKKVLTTWKFIMFSHNEHQVEQAVATAREWGMTWFSLKKSDRWNDAYRPEGVGGDWMIHLKPAAGNYSPDSVDKNVKYDIRQKFNSAGNFAL